MGKHLDTETTLVDDAGLTDDARKKAEKLAAQKRELLERLASANVINDGDRVAWVLNRHPETRDSDVTLALRYWATFEPALFGNGNIAAENLYRLTPQTTLTRARAKIQNDYNLFLATEKVRKRRGKLEEEHRDIHAEARDAHPWLVVYADESGKTDDNLLVGTFWIIDSGQTLRLKQDLDAWRQLQDFNREFHFKDVNAGNLHTYLALLDFLIARGNAISFKVLTLPRKGLNDIPGKLDDMLFQALKRGIEHEHNTGRAPLPRVLQVFKDSEGEARDRVSVANLTERLQAAGASVFDKKLTLAYVHAVESKDNDFIQIADLFLGSVNRHLHQNEARGTHAKDELARAFIDAFCGPGGINGIENDMVTFGEF
jgi:hypothetical protein